LNGKRGAPAWWRGLAPASPYPKPPKPAVAATRRLNAENDPHEEHDFGSLTLAGRKFFFKIEYYDAKMEFGSEDPANPAKTTQVLTIMLAEEY
jgi:hypothetical protein